MLACPGVFTGFQPEAISFLARGLLRRAQNVLLARVPAVLWTSHLYLRYWRRQDAVQCRLVQAMTFSDFVKTVDYPASLVNYYNLLDYTERTDAYFIEPLNS